MRIRLILSSICILLFITLQSCKKAVVSDIDAREYVLAYTQGMIHDNEEIEYRFTKDHLIDTVGIKNSFSVKPSFEYKIEYNPSKRTLKIRPTSTLKRGVEYDAVLDLERIFSKSVQKILVSKLKVFEQNIQLKKQGTVISEDERNYLQLKLLLALNEKIDDLYALFDYPKSKINITKISPTEYDIKIAFDNDEGIKKIKWDGKSIGVNKTGQIDWSFFDKEFEVTSTYMDKKSNEYLVYFSRLLDPKQDAKGLITIGDSDANYKIKDNYLRVFIDNKTSENINLRVRKGLRSKKGDLLKTNLNYVIESQMIKPEIQWLSDGVYIPSNGTFKIPFKAKGLNSVYITVVGIPSENANHYTAWNDMSYMDEMEMIRFGNIVYQEDYPLGNGEVDLEEWNEFGLDMTNTFVREKGMIYHIRMDYKPSNTILNCNDKSLEDFQIQTITEEWFNTRYRRYRYNNYYNYEDSQNPCKISFYLNNYGISKNIHCTNVFPIIKKGDKNVHVAVKELLNNKLAQSAQIDLINLQGLDIASKTLSNNGTTNFTDLDSDAQALRITYEGEISYFPIHNGHENPLTEFDISSNVRDVDNKLFSYTERDVWRPGDTMFMDVMINRSKFDFPEGLPVVVRLKNPKGVLYDKYVQSIKNDQSIYSFKMPTQLESKTGYWKADIKIGPLSKSHTLRVETIKPNVVELEYHFKNKNQGWIYNNMLEGNLEVNYLTGFPMRNGNVTTAINIYPVNVPFDKYKNYAFDPLKRPDAAKDVKLWTVKTNEQGISNIKSNKDFKQYLGVTKLIVDSKIDLPGGGLNTETESTLISPFTSYVGIEKVKGRGWRGSFKYGETPKINIVQLNYKGEPLKGNNKIEIEIARYTKDWWYDRYRLSRGHQSHQTHNYKTVYEEEIETVNGQYNYVHDNPKFESGMYRIKVTDKQSGHIAEYTFHHVKKAAYTIATNPLFINLELEKNEYELGEQISLNLPKIKNAKALVSLESGSKVHEMFWLDLDNPQLELNVKKEWFPNFYLHLSIVQNYGQTENDRPLRMYTVEKFIVNSNDNKLSPMIIAKEKVEPNKSFNIEVKEAQGKAMEYTLAVVDQGLLNLTGYQTPNPMRHFSKLVSLRVKTWDIFQNLINYLNPNYAGIISIGGDGIIDKKKDESADFNRFEPVVYHLGPFILDAHASRVHSIDLENYIGQLKVMLVACSNHSYGHEDKTIRVVSPLMLQSQLPRALNITDEVEVPITLFKDEKSIEEVQLSAKANNGLISFTKPSLISNFENDNQKIESLEFKTGEESGVVKIDFKATSGQYKSEENTKIFINYPNSYSERETRFKLEAEGEIEIPIECFGFDKTKNINLLIAGALLPNFSKHYNSLIQYPHGCLEQTTSRGFSMLFIEDLIALTPLQTKDKADYLDAAISKIKSYQRSDGRFNYWQNGYYHYWSDLYAGHFLIEANEKELLSDNNALDLWLDYHANIANSWSLSGVVNEYTKKREETIQAYRLFLLAKAGRASKSAMNRFRQRTTSPQLAKIFLSGAYHYISMNEIGQDLFNNAIREGTSDNIYSYSFGSPVRNKAISIYIMGLFNRGEALDRYYEDWVSETNSKSWFSTQEKGFCFLACSSYFIENQNQSNELDFEINSKLHSNRDKIPSYSNRNYYWSATDINDKVMVKNHGESAIFITKTERAISKELYKPAESNVLDLNVKYLNSRGEALQMSNIKHGEDISIIITVKNNDILDQENLALSLKAPAGWELLNPRLYKTNEDDQSNYIYQDFRDDKVYTYFNLNKNKTRNYTFKAKAAIKGKYYMPPIFLENMYDGNVYARGKAQQVVIK